MEIPKVSIDILLSFIKTIMLIPEKATAINSPKKLK